MPPAQGTAGSWVPAWLLRAGQGHHNLLSLPSPAQCGGGTAGAASTCLPDPPSPAAVKIQPLAVTLSGNCPDCRNSRQKNMPAHIALLQMSLSRTSTSTVPGGLSRRCLLGQGPG